MSKEAEEIKKLQQTIDELQTELKFLQETVGVLVGAMRKKAILKIFLEIQKLEILLSDLTWECKLYLKL